MSCRRGAAWPLAARAQEPGRAYRVGGPFRKSSRKRRLSSPCSTNFGNLVSSRAKTLRSIGAYTSRMVI